LKSLMKLWISSKPNTQAPTAMTEEELEELPAAKLRAAKKAPAAKKVAVKKAPVKKAAVKKEAATKKTVAPEPEPEPASAPAPVGKKIVRKKAGPKAALEPELDLKIEEPPPPSPAPEPVSKKKITTRRKAAPKGEEAEPVQAAPDNSVGAPAKKAPQTAQENTAEEEDQEPDDDSDNAPEPPQRGQAPQPGQQQLGPDGQPRKLTKWERWKLRKEKFKEMRRQRWLEKQGGRQGPGGPPPGEHSHSRAPVAEREPEPGNNGERAPRPEIPLGPPEDCAGLLELTPGKGFGFLRPKERNFVPLPTDPFVTPEMVRHLGLRDGLWIEAVMRRGGRGPQVIEIKNVNGRAPDTYRFLPLFEELTAINPNKRYILETEARRYTTRLIDFIAPIGRGQRGLIVAPPRAGKTTILQHIAEAVKQNYPDVKLMIVLIDERPEEVTEISRAVIGGEIMASNNDRDPRDHIRIAALAMERARRLVEAGEHVFMVLDSITRLARAFNNAIRGHGGGKGSLSGGVDARALEGARRMFASARNTREAGSLTIIGTALIETNSRADELIFQEFKGTGNMELMLDRKIAQQYIYPAIDIFKSGTRREELLLPPHQMEKVHVIRRGLAGHKPVEAMERLLHFMERFNNNAQLLVEIKSRE
jgi:transcription termination factor Rho